MDGYSRIGNVHDLFDGNTRTIMTIKQDKPQRILLILNNNIVYAMQTNCPHAGGLLQFGEIDDVEDVGLVVVCPSHSYEFSLSTGKSSNSAEECRVWTVRVVEESLWINIPSLEIIRIVPVPYK
jgi:nitrite reductase/ring-hydroxylating ferredoxin subunit